MYGNTDILDAKQFSNAINILFLFTWQLLVTSDAVFVQQKHTCVQHSGWSFGLSIHKKATPGSSYLLNGSEIFFSNQRYEFDVKRFTLSHPSSEGIAGMKMPVILRGQKSDANTERLLFLFFSSSARWISTSPPLFLLSSFFPGKNKTQKSSDLDVAVLFLLDLALG